jgi:hypothetical protein
MPGKWKIKASSGPNFNFAEFDVVPDVEIEGMIVTVEKIETLPGIGKHVTIRVLGASQTTELIIKSSEGKIVGELSFPASSSGEILTPWPVPKDTSPGVYTISVADAFNNATATFELE